MAHFPNRQVGVVFYEMLTGELPVGRLTVVQAAARMDTPESLAVIERRTHDSDETVRGEAAQLLEQREKGAAK